mgnify:CR=1 FL=1
MPLIDGKQFAQEGLLQVAQHCAQAALHAPQLIGKTEIRMQIVAGQELEDYFRVQDAANKLGARFSGETYKTAYQMGEPPVLLLIGADVTPIVQAPCRAACPAGIDVPRYIRLIGDGRYEEAVAVVRERVPLPSICAYVCHAPCEAKCRRGTLRDRPIAIEALKRFAVDHSRSWEPKGPRAKETGKRVAVIGSGPAGLTAAYYLRKVFGHGVTVFEALAEAGGMMRVGIPQYRLPREILDREIAAIEALGVEIKLNAKQDSVETLLEQGYDAVFVAVGAHRDVRLQVPGEDLPGVIECLSFLREVSLGKKGKVGPRVAVIGGGNAAMDAARLVHGGAQRGELGWERQAQEVEQVRAEIVGRSRPCEGSLGGEEAILGRRGRSEAGEPERQLGPDARPAGPTEIEQLGLVHREPTGPVEELAEQARLADPGLAADQHGSPDPVAAAGAEEAAELGELALAADEGCGGGGGRERGPGLEPQGPDRPVQTVEAQRARLAEREGPARRPADRLGHQDLARPGPVGEPRREVHGLAGDGVGAVRLASRAPGHDLPERQADVRRKRRLVGPGEAGHRGEQGPRATDRPVDVVAVRPGCAEQRHDAVADMFVDRSAVVHHDPVGGGEEALQQRVDPLRVEARGEPRVAHEVAEEHGDRPAITLGRRGRLGGCRGEPGDRREEALPVAERGDAQRLQIGVAQAEQDLAVDVVGVEGGRIAFEPEARQPGLDVQGGSSGGPRGPSGT